MATMKEQDIRPADIFERYLELSRQDAKELFSDSSVFEEIPCAGCEGRKTEPAFTKSGFQYVICGDCQSLFVSPRPPRDALNRFNANSPSGRFWAETFFPTVAESRRQRIFIPRVERLAGLFAQRSYQPGTVVDVGAGYGIFLEEFKRRFPAAAIRALEPSEKLAAECRHRGIETLELAIENVSTWTESADLVTSFEVIEHVYSPAQFVNALAGLLRPGGYLLVTGLGVEGFDIQVLWDQSKSVSPPHHLNFLSIEGFRKLFSRQGFREIEVTTPGELDLDIVHNEFLANSSVLRDNRFLRLLLQKRNSFVHEQFQRFLSESCLSSHVWVFARKASQ